jgi:hypothetical protein
MWDWSKFWTENVKSKVIFNHLIFGFDSIAQLATIDVILEWIRPCVYGGVRQLVTNLFWPLFQGFIICNLCDLFKIFIKASIFRYFDLSAHWLVIVMFKYVRRETFEWCNITLFKWSLTFLGLDALAQTDSLHCLKDWFDVFVLWIFFTNFA